MQNRIARLLLATALCASLAACATGEAGEGLAQTDVPQTWDTAPIQTDAATWPSPTWWQDFNSAELNNLIVAARDQNLDLAAAAARVLQAEAQARIAGSSLLPSVNLSAGASRSGPVSSDSTSSDRTSFSANLGASYELDFWGKNQAGLDAAEASLRASQYDRETVALTVTATVATTYFEILSTRDRLATANLNLDNAKRVLAITEARVNAGVATPLELAQQRGTVASQEAQIPGLEQQEREARATLAVLLGRPTQGFNVDGKSLAGLTAPTVKPGMPSELLARRPDIRQAEAQLVAADANIVAARAAFFPSISLSGSLSAASTALSSLFNPANIAYSIGASLVQTIFDAGRTDAEFDSSLARRQEILANYRSVVITAFSDVDVALGNVAALARQEQLRKVNADQAAEAFRIAELRYKVGVEDFISVLDAQRTLYSAQDSLSQAKLARMQAAVTLYRVLGGGWTDQPPQPPAAPQG